jgi:hypothetical protein
MNRKIGNILKDYKIGKLSKVKAVNAVLELTIVNKDNITICWVCNENILINGVCPKCTIELCTPPDKPIVLDTPP